MSVAETRVAVEEYPAGFAVTLTSDNGVPQFMPKTLPGHVCLFPTRNSARRYASALRKDDMAECHRLIGKHARFFRVAA